MNKIMQQVLSDIESIKISLETISNGVSIVDSFSPIATVINILTTIGSTLFGGWLTLELFKKQEKMRIRQELKLEFYNEYKNIYDNLIKDLSILENNFIQIKDELPYHALIKTTNAKQEIICVSYKYQKKKHTKFFEYIDPVNSGLNNLERLFESNDIIIKSFKEKPMIKCLEDIMEIKKTKDFIESSYEGFEFFNQKIILDAKDELSEDEKRLKDILKYFMIEKLVEENKNNIIKISQLNIGNTIKDIKKSVIDSNNIIQNECIYKYFKSR
ncbi:MAG: hypothetical protein IJ094_06125 [Bacilli bacterium]|nr:hypothetical protein [Bacilli bacterium]